MGAEATWFTLIRVMTILMKRNPLINHHRRIGLLQPSPYWSPLLCSLWAEFLPYLLIHNSYSIFYCPSDVFKPNPYCVSAQINSSTPCTQYILFPVCLPQAQVIVLHKSTMMHIYSAPLRFWIQFRGCETFWGDFFSTHWLWRFIFFPSPLPYDSGMSLCVFRGC